MRRDMLRRFCAFWLAGSAITLAMAAPALAQSMPNLGPAIIHKVQSANQRLEMTVNTSRILTLDLTIPQAQVNNPDILELTPLSPTQIQVFAKKPGVTQVNLWDENKKVYSIDVIVYGDARELSILLSSEFPNASIQVKPISNGVLLSGFVDQPEQVNKIVEISEQFYPKVLTNMQVGGVHQVLLHFKVMEVSRTKMRALGMDWVQISGSSMVASAGAGILGAVTSASGNGPASVAGAGTFRFNVVNGTDAFFGVIDAMRRDNLAKIHSEPTLTTVSGRPAQLQAGGEVPVVNGGGLGVPANTQYKPYGTRLDFVPIVLGNGQIRLEVRGEVSEIDASRSIGDLPAFRTRWVDTAAELKAGETLAIAGLLENKIEAERRGIPWLSEVPYLGIMFGRIEEQNNEVELLILVTPELISAMEPHQVPPCGPGTRTTSPNDWELYMRRHLEVPKCCPVCNGAGCPQCQQHGTLDPGMIGDESGQVLRPEQLRTPAPAPLGTPTAPKLPADQTPRLVPPPNGTPPATSSSSRRNIPTSPHTRPSTPRSAHKAGAPGLIGPVGYDLDP